MPFTRESTQLKHSIVHFIRYKDFDPSQYLDILTAEEKERFFSFSSEHRKMEFVATRFLRHELFGFEHIHYDVNGAPYIKGEGFISISHTKGIVGIAFNKAFRIGLDMEQRSDKAQRICSKFLSEVELNLFDVTNQDEMTLAWSAKETLYKIAGRKKIDFRAELDLRPSEHNTLIGGITSDGIRSSTEIHTFVHDDFVFTINESALSRT